MGGQALDGRDADHGLGPRLTGMTAEHVRYVGDADVEEAARPVRVGRCLERDRRLVSVGPPPTLMMIQLLASTTNDGSPAMMVSPPSTSV
jgi:hypothetical protein